MSGTVVDTSPERRSAVLFSFRPVCIMSAILPRWNPRFDYFSKDCCLIRRACCDRYNNAGINHNALMDFRKDAGSLTNLSGAAVNWLRAGIKVFLGELGPVKVGVEPARREQFLVAAAFPELALVDDQDLVRLADGGQPVGDHQRGAARQRGLERALDRQLRLGVQVRGGLVKDDETPAAAAARERTRWCAARKPGPRRSRPSTRT